MEVGLLTETMNAFVDAFSGGFDRLRGAMNSLLYLLISIDIAWFGVKFMLGMESVPTGLNKVMTIGMWSFIALHFDEHALALVDSLVQAGLIAAGAEGSSARTLLNPSAILDAGLKAAEPLSRNVLLYPLFAIAWGLMMLAYVALAINAFMVMIEYYLAIAVVGILLPFGVLSPTRWIAMKPMSYFLSCGLKMMVLAFLVAIGRTMMAKVQINSVEPTLRQLVVAITCTGMISLLCWRAPKLVADGFMTGNVSLDGSAGPRHAVAVGSNAARIATTAAGVIGGVSSALGGMARATMSTGSIGYTNHGSRPASQSQGPAPSAAPAGAAAFMASATGRSSNASKPPRLIPPPDSSDTSKKE